MPRWNPSQIWKGEDAYIIGGGDSLRSFDWGSIEGRHTIACNSGFILGSKIVEVVLFGDYLWWVKIGRDKLPEFGGTVVGCCPRLNADPVAQATPWLYTMQRYSHRGLAPAGSGALGWFGNTGAMAVNLALVLGAKRVFLLGFDMHLGPQGAANWHDLRYEASRASVYARFLAQFPLIARDLPSKFPGCEVWNVTDNSELDVFPKVSLAEHFHKESGK